MESKQAAITTVDGYIAQFSPEVQTLLRLMRETIRAAAPDAKEIISYGMPAFAQEGNLVYFAAAKKHIGLYPTSSGVQAFEADLAAYAHSKGAVQFPIDQPLPLDLVTRIVTFRVAENLARAAEKARKRASKSGRQG
jgi:uncharacterized protein YdhG (YjbR/CyaY superfamily)